MSITKFQTGIPNASYSNDDQTVTQSAGGFTIVFVTGTPIYTSGRYMVEFTVDAAFDDNPPISDIYPSFTLTGMNEGSFTRTKDGRVTLNAVDIVTGLATLVAGDKVTLTMSLDLGEAKLYLNGVVESTVSISLQSVGGFTAALSSDGDQVTVNGVGGFQAPLELGMLPWDGALSNKTVGGTIDVTCLDIMEDSKVSVFRHDTGELIGTIDVVAAETDYVTLAGTYVGDVYVVGTPISTSSTGKTVSGYGTLT